LHSNILDGHLDLPQIFHQDYTPLVPKNQQHYVTTLGTTMYTILALTAIQQNEPVQRSVLALKENSTVAL